MKKYPSCYRILERIVEEFYEGDFLRAVLDGAVLWSYDCERHLKCHKHIKTLGWDDIFRAYRRMVLDEEDDE